MEHITVRVPATSANLGPGFDCLGVALQLYNRVTVRRGPGGAAAPMVREAAAAYFDRSGSAPFEFAWDIDGDIPRSRGLGSSVAVRLGILHGLNGLDGSPLDDHGLYRLCAELEGHPDNAAPGAFGGFTAARADGAFFRCPIAPALRFVFLIPDVEIETESARRLLPAQIPFGDAVRNTANAALLTAAFAAQDYELLRGCLHDHLHEPYRTPLVPWLAPAVAAGIGAGALGGYLSGSGSAVACLTLGDPEEVARAMRAACDAAGARVLLLEADNEGAVRLD